MAGKEKKELTAAEVIHRRRVKLAQRKETRDLLVRVVFLVAAAWFLFTKLFLFSKVSGMEMFPSLKDGDLAVIYCLQKDYAVNEVIAYEMDGELRFGRVVACGNDVVTLEEDGTLLVNGTEQSGEILYPTYPREGDTEPERVPEGCVYVLGDYRTQSTDSRDFGSVPKEQVKGKVITILRRRGL